MNKSDEKLYGFDKENLLNLLLNYQKEMVQRIKQAINEEGRVAGSITPDEVKMWAEKFLETSLDEGKIKNDK